MVHNKEKNERIYYCIKSNFTECSKNAPVPSYMPPNSSISNI